MRRIVEAGRVGRGVHVGTRCTLAAVGPSRCLRRRRTKKNAPDAPTEVTGFRAHSFHVAGRDLGDRLSGFPRQCVLDRSHARDLNGDEKEIGSSVNRPNSDCSRGRGALLSAQVNGIWGSHPPTNGQRGIGMWSWPADPGVLAQVLCYPGVDSSLSLAQL